MEFTLTYRGPLKGNGNSADKQAIREYLHPQLIELWNHPPLSLKKHLLTEVPTPANEGLALIESRVTHKFVALVSSAFHLMADLQITFLRNGPPGSLISQGGDLDNRLKTLFDALSIPTDEQIKKQPPRATGVVEPFYCLLQDDSLISSFSVMADRLLNGSQTHSSEPQICSRHPELEVLILIRVSTNTSKLMIANLDL